MQPIYTQTVGSGGAASITFNNIPQTFNHLRVVVSGRGMNSGTIETMYLRFNGDSSSLYSESMMYSANTGLFANRYSAQTLTQMISNVGDTALANTFSNIEIYIPNYKSTSFFKSYTVDCAGANNSTAYEAKRHSNQAGLYRSTSAITSITLGGYSANIKQGTTATLYGIL